MQKIKTIGVRLSKTRPTLIILGWGTSLASIAVTGINSTVVVPHAGVAYNIDLLLTLYYGSIFGLSFFCGYLLRSLTLALIGFFCAYVLGLMITGIVVDLPGLVGLLPENLTELTAAIFTFTALFPFGLLLGLVGATVGAASSEA